MHWQTWGLNECELFYWQSRRTARQFAYITWTYDNVLIQEGLKGRGSTQVYYWSGSLHQEARYEESTGAGRPLKGLFHWANLPWNIPLCLALNTPYFGFLRVQVAPYNISSWDTYHCVTTSLIHDLTPDGWGAQVILLSPAKLSDVSWG